MILALDIGLNLGWAAGAPGVPFVSGTMVFSSTGRDIGRLYYAVRSAVGSKIDENAISHVVSEAPVHIPTNGIDSIETTFGIHATVALTCKDKGLSYRRIHMATARKTVLGFSRAPADVAKHRRREWLKSRIVGYCIARGWKPESDDAADALINLEFTCREIDPTYAAASAVEEMARGVA
ncbi:hypothetical protein [Parvibaculum sp.]|uniref:hypothetical protein n=1 Tax=Parvibaculum sp. TaxID=2024848 RepID=UPI001D9BF22C|nr:hypothetical protein [Parvibaculum sp.]MBX3490875.1 hypothetical protein [Parvibaculum sp.]